jgi:hypothetical protein
MTPDAVRRMADQGRGSQVHALVGMARKQDIHATHPEGQRRFYEFADGGFSNCNMFWIGSQKALRATEAFRHGGQFAKKPERIIKAFGILNLLRFRLGRHSLAQMFAFISRRFGVEVQALVFEGEGRLAIDVDNERTHRLLKKCWPGPPEATTPAARPLAPRIRWECQHDRPQEEGRLRPVAEGRQRRRQEAARQSQRE